MNSFTCIFQGFFLNFKNTVLSPLPPSPRAVPMYCLKPPMFSTPVGNPAFRRKGVLWFLHCQDVSRSVGKRGFSKTALRIFLKLLMKLRFLKGKTLTELDFWEKKLIFGIMPKITPKIGFFGFYKKKIIALMCKFFEYKSCTVKTFMILLKPYFWEKSGSWVKCKNALDQSDCRIFKHLISRKLLEV